MRKHVCVMLWVCCAATAFAQEEKSVSLKAEARADYQMEKIDGDTEHGNTGFKGKYLNVMLDGRISRSFSYSWRQRLNKQHADQSFWDATDWAYLSYEADEHWSLSAGKQVVGIGGYEYDRAPINLYVCSEFWNNIPCYQFGASVTYRTRSGNDKLMFQVCESPFQSYCEDNIWVGEEEDNLYAYNLMWMGKHGWLSTLYSVNMVEYLPGKYISYIALGHRVEWGKVALELDWMNRAATHQTFLLKDCSVMGELSYEPDSRWKVFGKVTYDVNRTQRVADYCVMPGTELTLFGGGVECFPLKGSRDIRFHAVCFYTKGHNGNPGGTRLDKQMNFHVGVTWRMDILSLTNKLLH